MPSRSILLLLSSIVGTLSTTCTIPDTSDGLHRGFCNGIHYTYNVPRICNMGHFPSSSCGLIVDVHGWSMNGDIQDLNTNMRELGEQHGFVVVQPTANLMWGRLPIPLPFDVPITSWQSSDYPIVWAIVLAARDEESWNIDLGRVHFMGFSQGAQMTWHMLATYGNAIASAVPLSCAANNTRIAASAAAVAKDVPILYSHGYTDGFCPFTDGNETIGIVKHAWQVGQGAVISQDPHHIRTAYRGKQGQVLETLFWDYRTEDSICGKIYEDIGFGHCFPGGRDTKCFEWDGLFNMGRTTFPRKMTPFSCPSPDPQAAAFKIGKEAVKWFLKHHKAAGLRKKPQTAELSQVPVAADKASIVV